jgi:hypothetical protein
LRRADDLNGELQHLEFALPRGPIHGDAHTAIGVERYGRPEQQSREFAGTYGFDVRTWPGYPVLREVRELTMTTWIMQNVEESPAVAAEFALRVGSLRERDFARAWHFF